MERKIDIIIITGFLGAGKTTLLNKLIRTYSDKEIGLLVNDFGKVPVDGSLIRESYEELHGSKVYEIGNGSIFCSCLTSSFIFGLRFFLKKKPEILFIETSGMSDPGSMAKILNDYDLFHNFRIKHVLAVQDSTNMLKLRKNLVFIDKQIMASNTILLNKADLVDDEQKLELGNTVKSINPRAEIHFTYFGDFDYSRLNYAEFFLDRESESCNTAENAPRTMFLNQNEYPMEDFLSILDNIVNKVLRLKGFFRFGENTYYLSNNNGVLQKDIVRNKINCDLGITLIYEGRFHDQIREIWNDFKGE